MDAHGGCLRLCPGHRRGVERLQHGFRPPRREPIDNFGDAIDFVGWYNDQSYHRNQIDKTDAYRLYLAYHEGHGGYSRQTYSDKAWLLDAARNVASRANEYDGQLQRCERRLQRRWWWPF